MAPIQKLKGSAEALTVFALGELLDEYIRIERLIKGLSVRAAVYGLDISNLLLIRKKKHEAEINTISDEKKFLEQQLESFEL